VGVAADIVGARMQVGVFAAGVVVVARVRVGGFVAGVAVCGRQTPIVGQSPAHH